MWGWMTGGEENAQAPVYPELETPINKQDYENLAAKLEKDLIAHVDGISSFHLIQDQDGVALYDKILGDSPVHLVAVVGNIPVAPKAIADGLWAVNLERRKRWDHDLLDYQVKEEITPSIQVVFQLYSAPTGVAPREVVAIRALKEKAGTYIIWGGSINYALVKGNSANIRAAAYVSGWVIQPIESGSKIFHIVQVDPKGWIPPFVVNSSKLKPASRLIELRKNAIAGTL